MQKDIKRAKVFNYTIAVIFLVIFIFTVILFGIWEWNRTFTFDKWMSNLNDRYVIVSDMLSKNNIVGMVEGEIISLLGNETDNAPETFKHPDGIFSDEKHLTYSLGGFMDTEYLIIEIENGVAINYTMGIK